MSSPIEACVFGLRATLERIDRGERANSVIGRLLSVADDSSIKASEKVPAKSIAPRRAASVHDRLGDRSKSACRRWTGCPCPRGSMRSPDRMTSSGLAGRENTRAISSSQNLRLPKATKRRVFHGGRSLRQPGVSHPGRTCGAFLANRLAIGEIEPFLSQPRRTSGRAEVRMPLSMTWATCHREGMPVGTFGLKSDGSLDQ